MIKNKSKNLFDTSFGLSGFEIGSINTTTGLDESNLGITYTYTDGVYSLTNSVAFRGIRTDFIPVAPSTPYFLSVEKLSGVDNTNPYASGGFFYYDSNKSFISITSNIVFTTGGRTGGGFTTPSNAAYIRFRFFNATATTSTWKNVQLELGSTATAYVPYNDIQVAVGQFEQGQGKNLFDKPSMFIGNFYTNVDGSLTPDTNHNAYRINVEANKTYTISRVESGNLGGSGGIVRFENNTNGLISVNSNGFSSPTFTFTTPANTHFIVFSISIARSNNSYLVELGNTATAYEPYKYLAIHNPASNDIPIPALNNKTLNEVFVGGNHIDLPMVDVNNNGVFDQAFISGGVTASFTNGFQFLQTSFNNTYLRIIYESFTIGTKYYVNFNAKKINNTSGNFNIGFGSTNSFESINRTSFTNISFDNFARYSLLRTIDTIPTLSTDQILMSGFSGTSSNVMFNDLYVLNLTSLGIASQTQAQMDAYFEAWQRNNAGTLLANTFIQHDQNSVPIADLNGKTLDEVFIGGNLVANVNFSNGTTGWTSANLSSFTVADNVASFTASSLFGNITNVITPTTTINDVIFTVADVKSTSNQVRFDPNSTPFAVFHSGSNNFERLSIRFTASATAGFGPRVVDNRTTGFDQIQVKNVYWINLTALGITATKEVLDFWYSVWQQNHKLGMRVHRASGNDIPLAVLNNQSLNQVFVGGQLVTNGDFTNGTTGWNSFQSTSVVIDNNLINTASGVSTSGTLFKDFTSTLNDQYYARTRIKILNNDALSMNLVFNNATGGNITILSPVINQFVNISSKFTHTSSSFVRYNISHSYSSSAIASGKQLEIDFAFAYNLTSLGIATLTQSQLDYLYQVWQFNQVNALVARQFIQEA